MTAAKGLIDLGDGVVMAEDPNRDGMFAISDAETGATLGWAGGGTPDALQADITRKVQRVKARRAARVEAAAAKTADMVSARDKAIAALQAKSTPATATTATADSTKGGN